MLSTKRSAGRFSLLLLDENEYYVRDFVATCSWPAEVQGNWQQGTAVLGQLRLCTKSLFFEPDDVRVPIVRLPFEHLEQLEGVGNRGVAVVSCLWSKMKPAATDVPYIFEKGRLAAWRFELTYAALADFMPLAQQMMVASRLPPVDQESVLEGFVAGLEGSLRFDLGHLRSPSTETISLELPAFLLAPLVRDPGRLAVTPSRLYFQPAHNIAGDKPVLSHAISLIAAVARRRSGLKDVGLEVFFVNPERDSSVQGPVWGAASAFFAFNSTGERDCAVEALMKQSALGTALPGGREAAAACGSILEAGGEWLGRVTAAWQRGRLSNYDYLLYCNLAAGRSFNDLTQYPVFPWVLSDYTSPSLDLSDANVFRDLSRPVGALSPPRLARFRERFREMSTDSHPHEPPFLYGTHYSCPGYTLFWLVRFAPAHMLRLQNGRFDAPDRLFCSISEAWDSVLTNPTDVKELIPEFFMSGRAEFLKNSRRLALGNRQDGRVVGDVELPPWANGSPDQFIAIQRAALEAPFVSANLHHWIDLIFGVEQQGDASVDSDNVFRHLTYEGAVDPSTITDRMEKMALEVAINEFGQCPRQLFHHPHPSRLVCPPPLDPETPTRRPAAPGEQQESLSLALLAAIQGATQDVQSSELVAVPELLRTLDVINSRPRVVEEQPKPQRLISSRQGASVSSSPSSAASLDGGGQREQASSPFASSASKASAGIMGRLGALKDALNDAVGSPDKRADLTAGASGRLSNLAGSLSTRFYSLTSSKQSQSSVDQDVLTGETAGNQRRSDTVPPSGARVDSTAPSAVPPSAVPPIDTKVLPSSGDVAAQAEDSVEGASCTGHGADTLLQTQRERMLSSNIPSRTPEIGSWGPNLRGRIQEGRTLAAGSEAVNSVALCKADSSGGSDGGLSAYAACHDGLLRVFDVDTGAQKRASRLSSQPLTSLALYQQQDDVDTLAAALCGSYDGRVYTYSPSSGIISGSFEAHNDAVSCLEIALNGSTIATASWDCSLKIWTLAEGRSPWDSTFPQPTTSVADLPGGVWSVSLSPEGHSALVGTEDGCVAMLDFRQQRANNPTVWQCTPSADYIGGVALLPGGNHALAACADGTFTLLDTRKSGATVSVASCATPLRCCLTDGSVAIAGGENGAVVFWDVGQQLGRGPVAGTLGDAPGLDGLYRPLQSHPASAVNALGWGRMPGGVLGGETFYLATGHEGGLIRIYWAPQ